MGTHLNTTHRAIGTTLTKRLCAATVSVCRTRSLPVSFFEKQILIRTKALPLGLYGCESTHASVTALRTLRSKVADAIGPHSAARSASMQFAIMTPKHDLDPQVEILVRRCLAVRRCEALSGLAARAAKLVEHYKAIGTPGTNFSPEALAVLKCQPPPRRTLGATLVVSDLPSPTARLAFSSVPPLNSASRSLRICACTNSAKELLTSLACLSNM
jgi:hypothetical protein